MEKQPNNKSKGSKEVVKAKEDGGANRFRENIRIRYELGEAPGIGAVREEQLDDIDYSGMLSEGGFVDDGLWLIPFVDIDEARADERERLKDLATSMRGVVGNSRRDLKKLAERISSGEHLSLDDFQSSLRSIKNSIDLLKQKGLWQGTNL